MKSALYRQVIPCTHACWFRSVFNLKRSPTCPIISPTNSAHARWSPSPLGIITCKCSFSQLLFAPPVQPQHGQFMPLNAGAAAVLLIVGWGGCSTQWASTSHPKGLQSICRAWALTPALPSQRIRMGLHFISPGTDQKRVGRENKLKINDGVPGIASAQILGLWEQQARSWTNTLPPEPSCLDTGFAVQSALWLPAKELSKVSLPQWDLKEKPG